MVASGGGGHVPLLPPPLGPALRKDQKENYISGQYEVTNTVLIEFPLLIKN